MERIHSVWFLAVLTCGG